MSREPTPWSAKDLRIIETENGRFMPQLKAGFLAGWKFMDRTADTSRTMLTMWLTEDDPAKAASFATEIEARAFMERFAANIDLHWQCRSEAQERERQGVRIKRVIHEP